VTDPGFTAALAARDTTPLARTAEELRRAIGGWRDDGLSVGFVPTMGALHEGHLALVRRALELADRAVVSIFVNPAQFDEAADLDAYPRVLEADLRLLAAEGCHLAFAPAVETVYPPGHTTFIDVGGPSEGLEGEYRPGHFRGVATVVAQLFQLVRPDLAVFGEKDAQQLAVVRRLVRDLHFPVEIVGHPTVREADGLAMSSRNVHLSPDERTAATVLYRALTTAREAIESGLRDADEVRAAMRETLEAEPLAAIDYAEVVDADDFQPVERIDGLVIVPLAVRIGDTRLIDNFEVRP
jgi:pantoate--beta-alanine ligase